MLMDTLTGSDDYRIKGRRGTYIIVQANERAYEIMLQCSENNFRVIGYAPTRRQAEREVKRIDNES